MGQIEYTRGHHWYKQAMDGQISHLNYWKIFWIEEKQDPLPEPTVYINTN